MKKSFLFLVFCSLLFAEGKNDTSTKQEVSNVKLSKQEIKKVKYDKALLAFKNKKYDISFDILYELFLEDLENVDINFYLARSAFELKQYDEALIAYERVLFQKPDTIRVRLEIARTYFMQKDYIPSKQLFEDIKKEEHPKAVIDNINIYLGIIETKLSKHSLKGIFLVGGSYDSNLNNRALSDDFYIPALKNINNGIINNSTKDQGAFAHQEVLLLNHIYKYKYNMNIKNDIVLFNKNVINHSNKNILMLSYTPSLEHIYNDKLTLNYGLFIDRLYFGSPLLMDTYGLLPKFNYKFSKDITIDGTYKYQVKKYNKTTDKGKDSVYQQLNLTLNKVITPEIKAIGSIILEKERKDSGNVPTVDFDSYSLSLGLEYKYSKKLTLAPKITYKKKSNKDTDNLYLVKQTDKEFNYNLTGTYLLNQGWVSQGIVNYSDVTSNVPSSEYKKYTLGINFIKPF